MYRDKTASSFRRILHHVKQNAEKMEQTAQHDKQVEYGMDIGVPSAEGIEHGADRIGNAAAKEQPHTACADGAIDGWQREDQTPAHAEI